MTAVQPLRQSDEEEWRSLWRAYLEFYESELPETVYRETFRRLIGEGEYDPRGMIARTDGVAVGLVHYLPHRHCWKTGNVCYLQDLYAAQSARGQGVGRALIEAVYAEADRLGWEAVYWMTADDNATARILYDKVAQKTPFIKYQR